MNAKPLYNRICTCCGVMFQSPQKGKHYCPKCTAEARHRAKQAWLTNNKKPKADNPSEDTTKPVLSISDISRISKQYYDAHKTYLHYGDVVEKIRTGEIKVVKGKDGAEYGGKQ